MIYIVEDDNSIRELVVYTLENSGFKAMGFSSSTEFFAAITNAIPRAVLLDIMLPGDDGITILKRLRGSQATKKLPVIMLTAKTTEYDKVLGLDCGADDYITKPFSMVELLARIKSLIRRTDVIASKQPLSLGGISLDHERHTVFAGNISIELTYKEFELLSMLMTAAGKVLTRDFLLGTIWGYEFDGETRTIDVHVRSLRSKLGIYGDSIETVRGVGYKMRAGV